MDKNNKKHRCNQCNKRLSIIENNMSLCKCMLIFCNKCRFFKNHNCTFDYIKYNQNKIKKDNIKIKNKLIESI